MHRKSVKQSMLTAGNAVLKSAAYLESKGVDSPRLDAELLLGSILRCDRLHLYMDWQKPLTDLEVSGYREYIRRRGQEREPVARILGHREFLGREFKVTEHTFIPRPETEGLVERALLLMEKEEEIKEGSGAIFEIGTGTGCIIITLAAQSDSHHYIATDVSAGALETANKNARLHGVSGLIDFRQGPYFCGFRGALSLIISNPPYIRSAEIPELMPEVSRYDPQAALDGGPDGLDAVRAILKEGTDLLLHGGYAALELGEDHCQTAAQLFRETEKYDHIKVDRDLAGKERYLIARRV